MTDFYNSKHKPPGRRAGLTRAGFSGPSLLQTIRVPGKNNAMAPRTVKTSLRKARKGSAVMQETEEDINVLPLSSDDYSASDDAQSADMYKTVFRRPAEPIEQAPVSRSRPIRAIKGNQASVKSNAAKSSSKSGSLKKSGNKTSSSSRTGRSKRKSQEDLPRLGLGMEDAFGRVNVKKVRKPVYGSAQTRFGSSQSAIATSTLNKNKLSQDTSKRKFNRPTTLNDSDSDVFSTTSADSPKRIFNRPTTLDESDSDVFATTSADSPKRKFIRPTTLDESDSDVFATTSADSPKRKFIRPTTLDGSDSDVFATTSANSPYGKYNRPTTLDDSDSDVFASPAVHSRVETYRADDSPGKNDTEQLRALRKPVLRENDSSDLDPASPKGKFISGNACGSLELNSNDQLRTFTESVDDSLNKGSFSRALAQLQRKNEVKVAEPPATQLHAFRKFEMSKELDDDLVHTSQEIMTNNETRIPAGSTFDDDFTIMTQLARCPMCNHPVDPDDLRALGDMNTRQQEKFCRAHQKKSAIVQWEVNAYPDIQWETLNSRIAQHYSFIKELVKGKDCHYRKALDENVKAGKDRSLLKMTSNPTPGYYGSRGLREISETIMKEFTPLLKKQIVTDRLMAARGVTGFVQSVLVPEVTVLLIMEDMNIDTKRARAVLTESVAIGELVHEEVRDVVLRRVEGDEFDQIDR